MDFMKLGAIFLAMFTILVISISIFFGSFNIIKFNVEELGPFDVVFEDYIGDYKETGPVMDKIYYDLIEDEIETTKGFGLYYDDPAKVDASELRSKIGVILEPEHKDKIEFIKTKYNYNVLDVEKYVVTSFPYYNKMSIIMGIMKVYPKLAEYVSENDLQMNAVMEIYDIPNKRITYLMKYQEN